jgi:hypothetical protein
MFASRAGAVFQQIHRAVEIVFHHLAAAAAAIHACEHTGIGRGIDDPVRVRQILHIRRAPHIAVHEVDADPLQRGAIHLAPRAAQIIDSDHFPFSTRCAKSFGNFAAGKAADACDQNSHERDASGAIPSLSVQMVSVSRMGRQDSACAGQSKAFCRG